MSGSQLTLCKLYLIVEEVKLKNHSRVVLSSYCNFVTRSINHSLLQEKAQADRK